MTDLSLGEFLGNVETAGQMCDRRTAYLESLKELNKDTKRKKMEAEQAKMVALMQQAEADQVASYDRLVLDKSIASLLDGMMSKGARMGTEDRKDMPQVSAKEVRESDIPTKSVEFVDPKKLKYIQADKYINKTKVQGIADHWDTVGKQPVLISRDNWVIDGHHRVEAAKLKNKWVRVVRIKLPGRKALNAVKKLD